MYNLLCIGDPIIDTHVQIAEDCAECSVETMGTQKICFEYGAKIPIIDSFQDLGGNAPNVAAAAAKLGLTTTVIATVGDDANGRMAIEFLKKYKVGTELVTTQAGVATRYSIVLNYKTDRTILSYSEKKEYIWPEPIPATQWIYYTGLSEGYEVIQDKLVQFLDNHPTVRLAVNPGSYMLKYGLPRLSEILKRTDLLIVNLEEAQHILNTTLVEAKTPEALVRELAELGPSEVVLTDGARGAWATDAEEVWFQASFPIHVVAKTGAGDAFSAGYIAARLKNHDIQHALVWGTANSSGVIQAHGAHAGILDERSLQKMIEKFSAI